MVKSFFVSNVKTSESRSINLYALFEYLHLQKSNFSKSAGILGCCFGFPPNTFHDTFHCRMPLLPYERRKSVKVEQGYLHKELTQLLTSTPLTSFMFC